MEGDAYEDDHLKLLQIEEFENSEEFNAERLKNDEDANADLHNEDPDDDDDDQYKFFLSHVKGNGKSFRFKIKEENGLNKIIEYQKEEPIYGTHDLQRNENMDIILEKISKDMILVGEQSEDFEPYTDDYMRFLQREELENGEDVNGMDLNADQFVKSDEKVEEWDLKLLQIPFDEPAEILKNDEDLNEDLQNEDSDDDDSQYKIFLNHVKGNGKSFTFEREEENGLSKIIEYQKEESIYDRRNLKRHRNMNNTMEKKGKRKKGWSEPQPCKDKERNCLRSFLIEKSNTRSHKHTSKNHAVSRFLPKSDKDGLDKIGDQQWDKSHSVGRDVMNRKQNFEDDYQRFLNSFEKETGMKNLPSGNNKNIGYDGGLWRGNVLGHEVKNLRLRKSGNNNGRVEEDIIWQTVESPETAALKSKVMAILRKPFDEQEYKNLWHVVTKRNFKVHHKELQDGNEKSITTRHKGKSYLKRYKAVQRELEAVPDDKRKRLNILRGFVFYLEHLGWGGEFKPWEDASCLAVMPGGSY